MQDEPWSGRLAMRWISLQQIILRWTIPSRSSPCHHVKLSNHPFCWIPFNFFFYRHKKLNILRVWAVYPSPFTQRWVEFFPGVQECMSGTTSIGLGAQSVEECGCHEGTMKTQAPGGFCWVGPVGPAERLDTKGPKGPRCAECMGIFTYSWLKFMANVGKYTYHTWSRCERLL